MKAKVIVFAKTVAAVLCGLGLVATLIAITALVRTKPLVREQIITTTMYSTYCSVNGLHQSDRQLSDISFFPRSQRGFSIVDSAGSAL